MRDDSRCDALRSINRLRLSLEAERLLRDIPRVERAVARNPDHLHPGEIDLIMKVKRLLPCVKGMAGRGLACHKLTLAAMNLGMVVGSARRRGHCLPEFPEPWECL